MSWHNPVKQGTIGATMRTKAALFFFFCLLPLSVSAMEDVSQLKKLTLRVESLPVHLDAIPIAATHVRLLPLVFHAGCEGDVQIEYIRIKRFGPGDSADIQGIYILSDARRVTRTGTISSSGQTVLLGLKDVVVPKCKSLRLDTAIDIKRGTAAGSRFALSIESATDIKSTAEVTTGDFPLRTKEPLKVVPDEVGSVVVTFVPIGKIQAVRDETLARFTIEASGGTHQLLQGITLTNKGTARNEEIRNLYLTQRGGKTLSPIVKTLTDDTVTLTYSQPYFLRQGQRVTFELRGTAYRTAKSINFVLEEASDLLALPNRRSGRTLGDRTRMLRYGTE